MKAESKIMQRKVVVNKFCALLFLLAFLEAGSAFGQSPRMFRASVVKIDITPEDSQNLLGYGARKSTGIHDRIYHRIVAMDDGVTQVFLVSTDICEFAPSEYDKVAARLKTELGINPAGFWWTVTHTHSAPEVGPPGLGSTFLGDRFKHEFDVNYTSMIEKKLVDGIREARQKLAAARLGVGWGFAQANINRRARDIDGSTSLGLNPDGAVDRRIGLLKLEKEDGSPMVTIANYAIHGTVLGQENMEISGDVAGVVAEYVEQKTGAPMLLINGAAGNLAPIYSVYPNPKSGHLSQFRVLLGDKILEATGKISTSKGVELKIGSLTVRTPRKAGLGWPEDMANYSSGPKAGTPMILLPVRFLRINEDVAIWSAPLELFCEISNDIRDHSPFPYTFYFGYSNGWLGYLLTEDEWQYGGYEPVVSPYTPAAAKDVTEAVTGYLNGELRNVQGDHSKNKGQK